MTEVANYDFARDAAYHIEKGEYELLDALEDVMGFIEAGKFGTPAPTRMWSAIQRIRIGIESAVLSEVLEMAQEHKIQVAVTPGEPVLHLVKDGVNTTMPSMLEAYNYLYEYKENNND